MRRGAVGWWRATRTPQGPVTTLVDVPVAGQIRMRAWGPGAAWSLDSLPELVGLTDDVDAFADMALDPLVADLRRRYGSLRLCRSKAVFEALVPTIIEQKVVGLDAKRSYAALVRSTGEMAPPAPGAPPWLRVPPAPAALLETPSYVFHRCNIERKRADTLRWAASYSHRLEEVVAMSPSDAYRRLTALPGIGPWSAAEVSAVALGDPDAVSVGDYHLPNQVAWALAGEPRADDARMLELLEPYRGQRGRVVRLLLAGLVAKGGRGLPPRRGPRMPRQSIAAY